MLVCAGAVSAQELRCTVTVNADQVEGSNKEMFKTLQQTVTDFVNTTRWTDLVFAEQERIECNMMFIVNAVTTDGMIDASLQVQSRRPVYGTSYTTTLLNLKDNDCTFAYQEYDRMDYQPPQFTSNLTAIVTYYCYLILGYDLDSYSKLGGTACFQRCEQIAASAQTASLSGSEQNGWKAFGSTHNRHVLINNLMDEAFRNYRLYFYQYHRMGLDIMASNSSNGRATISEGLSVLKEAKQARPSSFVVSAFMDAKNDELTNLYSKATDSEKNAFLTLMESVDPTRMSQYEKVKEEK
ncbi:MAG: DUF4835 family protein [Paludibacteraceae bacterium]|nr:DUF4835 family protein [Paludibacteraceae bacterium]